MKKTASLKRSQNIKKTAFSKKPQQQIVKKRRSINKRVGWLIISLIMLILALLPSYYFYNKYQKTQALLQTPNKTSIEETKTLLEQVGKLIELPTGESPTFATVSDKTKLQGQPFFAKAENGDKVLIYSNAKKAILYRSSINKIIEVAPVNLSQNQSSASASSQQVAQSVKVVLYNGTSTAGLTNSAEAKIKGKISNIEVSAKSNAVKKDYQNTVIVDLSGNQSQTASELAALLGGKIVSSLPSGESRPTADIVVILGKDFVK